MNRIEIFGLVASAMVVISFSFRDVKLIRIVNIIGSIMYVIYGFVINSISNMVMNAILVCIHLYYLRRNPK